MASTLQCPRNHVVPFAEDDRGSDVYCPVCGVACPVPEAESNDAGPLRCRNGHAVSFTDDERGGEVYCRTCGVAVEIPAGLPVPRRLSVFTTAGEARAASNVAGRMSCPRCRHPVEYTVGEYGDTAYCTKCGAAVDVGQSLQDALAERAGPEETATTPVAPEHRGKRGLVSTFALILALMIGFFVATSQFPESMPFDATGLPWNKSMVAGTGEANVDPNLAPKELPKPKPQPDKKITMDMVSRLLRREDAAAALDDAERWRDLLVAHQIPRADPRLAGIEKAIPVLKQRLADAQPPVAVITPAEKCLDVLDRMLSAIERKNVPEGRRLGKDAQALLNSDPDLQTRYSARLEKQFAMLEDLARKPPPGTPDKTVLDVEKLLEASRALAQKGQVTEALEERARALFLGPRVESTPVERRRLTATVKELTTIVVKARGLRAVQDAEKCAAESDREALKLMVAEAMKDLPEFTSDPACRKAYDRAQTLAKKVIAKPADTMFGREVLFRHEYELMLDLFRDGDKLLLAVEAGERAQERATDAAKKKVLDFAAEGIDSWLESTGDGERDADRRAAASAALAKAKAWLGDDAWKKISTKHAAKLKPE